MTSKSKKFDCRLIAAVTLISVLLAAVCCACTLGGGSHLDNNGTSSQLSRGNIAASGDNVFDLFSVSNAMSKVYYGTYDCADHTPTPTPQDAMTGKVSGITVKLAQGDFLRYNKVIDLSECTEQTDALNQLLSLCITPDVIGSLDAETIDVFFTDAYDPDNYFQVNVFNSQEGIRHTNAYIKGRAVGQQLTGREWNADKKHVENIYGFPVRLSYAGLFANYKDVLHTVTDNSVNISVNYAKREIHSAIRKASATSSVVCDLDSTDDFARPWQGFTTGECFMSIRAGNFAKEYSNFVITRINGQEAKALTFTDRVAPKITVDTGIYSTDALPEAVINTPYPLFKATALSPYDGAVEVKTSVRYNGGEVTVSDGAFTPTGEGQYEITYEAKDNYGFTGSTVLTVTAPQRVDDMVIADLGYAAECDAGTLLKVPTPSVTGGSGIATVVKRVDYSGEVTELDSNEYRPTKAGTYTFTVIATDYCGQKKIKTHVLTVNEGNKPVFTQDAVLPRYFISGSRYNIPQLNARDFTDGSGKEVKSVVTVRDSDGEKNVRGGVITPVARQDGEIITVTYTATLAGKSSASVSYDIPTVIVKENERFLHLDKLLYSPDGSVTSVEAGENGTYVTASKDGAKIDFVNPMPSHGFSFEFGVPEGKAQFGALTLILTDAENPDIAVKFTYRKAIGCTEFITDGASAKVAASQKFGTDDTFGFTYDALRNEASFDPELKATVTPTLTVSGEKFNGFTSGKVYLTAVFEDLTAQSQLLVISIGGQNITNVPIDFVAPSVAVMGDTGGTHRHGTVFTMPVAIAGDAVDYAPEFSFTVTDPDGNAVTAVDGTYLSNVTDCTRTYDIKLAKIGSYTVRYTATDSAGNSSNRGSYVVQVVDINKPVITVNGSVPSGGSVGKQIVVPSAAATDDITENVAVKIYLITSKGQIVELRDRAFTPKSAGKYVVRYWCCDAAGNITTADYAVTVK